MMDTKIIKEAILQQLEVEVWRTYAHQFGKGNILVDEMMGCGRIAKRTTTDIILDDGMRYPIEGSEIRIKQKEQ
ncbi:hypothetical protein ACFPPD_06670 [Cohnella suwonensis]|uniref:Uncharacterized protein n=1 Tax=Cohnella suwonensis TaxID=696072 RepID=A0ABW0LUB4_9BACL